MINYFIILITIFLLVNPFSDSFSSSNDKDLKTLSIPEKNNSNILQEISANPSSRSSFHVNWKINCIDESGIKVKNWRSKYQECMDKTSLKTNASKVKNDRDLEITFHQ